MTFKWGSRLKWQAVGRTFGMQSLRNGDRPAWGRRMDGVGRAGGAAVALAKPNIIPKSVAGARAFARTSVWARWSGLREHKGCVLKAMDDNGLWVFA